MTSPTPGTVCRRSLTVKRARSETWAGGRGPESDTHMMGWSSGFCFVMTGGSMSAGRRRWTCAILV
jgi:hypothetical protein